MRPKTARMLAFALAMASLVTPNLLAAGEATVPPRLLSTGFIQASANKAECIVPETILARMQMNQAFLGGRTVALIEGADQGFADRWRLFAQSDSAIVSVILAHGFANPVNGQVLINIVEFDDIGCAFSHTLLTGESWNRIVRSLAEGRGGPRQRRHLAIPVYALAIAVRPSQALTNKPAKPARGRS